MKWCNGRAWASRCYTEVQRKESSLIILIKCYPQASYMKGRGWPFFRCAWEQRRVAVWGSGGVGVGWRKCFKTQIKSIHLWKCSFSTRRAFKTGLWSQKKSLVHCDLESVPSMALQNPEKPGRCHMLYSWTEMWIIHLAEPSANAGGLHRLGMPKLMSYWIFNNLQWIKCLIFTSFHGSSCHAACIERCNQGCAKLHL